MNQTTHAFESPRMRIAKAAPGATPRARSTQQVHRARPNSARTRQPAHLDRQRLRLLHRHAHQGRAPSRRKRATPVRPRRLARFAPLQRPRTSCTRAHRRDHADQRRARSSRHLGRSSSAVQRARARRAALGDHRHECLEPDRDRDPNGVPVRATPVRQTSAAGGEQLTAPRTVTTIPITMALVCGERPRCASAPLSRLRLSRLS
jgi:hypothetical protein